MRDDLLYDDWKTELKIWQQVTDLAKEKQGPAIFLSLTGKSRQTALAEIDTEKLNSNDGVEHLTDILDKLFLKDEAESAYSSFESFTNFKRPVQMSIRDYIVEFNLRLKKIETHEMKLPDGVKAYYLLHCSNLSPEKTSLCRATCRKLTYDNMKGQIERVAVTESDQKSENKSAPNFEYYATGHNEFEDYYDEQYDTPPVEQDQADYDATDECEDAYYMRRGGSYNRRGQYSGSSRGQYNQPNRHSGCRHCHSPHHWVNECPQLRQNPPSRFARGASNRGIMRGGHRGQGNGRAQHNQYNF